jgi:hypothetical protein
MSNAFSPAAGVRGADSKIITSQKIGAQSILDSQRFKTLDYRQSYGDSTNHDWKMFDFDGRVINAGPVQQQPFLSEQASHYVPLRIRRPSSPVRLAKIIVDSYTSLLFGEDRFPKPIVAGDQDTQDFKGALIKSSRMRTRLIQARNLGGAMGTVGISWCYRNGQPRVEVHNAKNLWVHKWRDRNLLVPEWVSEVYVYYKDEYNFAERKYYRKFYWYRRDWTPDQELIWKPVPYVQNREPDWEQYVDEAQSVEHNDDICHLVWIQNLPTDDVDGVPDYHGLYESFDAIDMLSSVLVRGTTLNLDPTLVIKVDEALQIMGGSLRKGSDNSLNVGLGGDANYMELSGASVTAGKELFELMRRTILEGAQCVVPDPAEIAAQGTSSVAMKVVYRPMLARGSVLREQYGEGIERILEQMAAVARVKMKTAVPVTNDAGEPTGEETIATVDLPPRIKSEPALDEDGNPTGEQKTSETPHDPGEGGETILDWGEWFPLTPQDKNQMATTLSLAAGAKAIISVQSATEELAAVLGRDAAEEWKRAASDATKQAEQDKAKLGAFGADDGGPGGKVDAEGKLPFGAKPRPGQPGKPGAPPPFGAKKPGAPPFGKTPDDGANDE